VSAIEALTVTHLNPKPRGSMPFIVLRKTGRSLTPCPGPPNPNPNPNPSLYDQRQILRKKFFKTVVTVGKTVYNPNRTLTSEHDFQAAGQIRNKREKATVGLVSPK
jgi:hypothetical protein